MSRPPIRSIAVFGGGLVALSAAAAFARALPGVSIELIRTPLDPAALADRLPGTLPTVGDPADYGIDEAALVARGAATHRVGQSFADWGATRLWFSGFGATGVPIAGAAFHQHWLAAHRKGARTAFDRYSTAAMLAQAERFVHPVDDARSPLSQFAYALRLDPRRAPQAMLDAARRSGIGCDEGAVAAVDRGPDGRIHVVRTDRGRAIGADLFVDCTGPVRSLAAGSSAFEDWAEALPCDRLLLAVAESAAPSPTDRYTAIPIGWRATWPLRDAAITALSYSAAITSDADARRAFGIEAAEGVAFRPGRLAAAWQGNMVALGDSAVVIDPLGWTGLALAHAGIALALELLPGRDFHPLEIAEYNRRIALRHRRARDFVALHYAACPHTTGAFWEASRAHALPAGLARSLGQFARRGTLPHHEEESFDRESWIAAMIGLGVIPQQPDPAALSADPAIVAHMIPRIEQAVATVAPRLPRYAQYLAGMAAAA